MKLKQLTLKDVEISLEILDEDIPVRGSFESGDPDYAEADKQLENEIIERLNQGDLWAWCCVRVTATWGEFEGNDYLGGCSYRDEKEFRAEGGYFEDMCREALADLNAKIERTAKRIAPLCDSTGSIY
jgi:hypothetical protein